MASKGELTNMKRLIDEEKIKKTNEFYEKIHQIEMEYYNYWKEHTLWHWEFWLSLVLTFSPWVLWFIFRKRGSEARLLLAGTFTLVVASTFDLFGVAFGLWHYSGKVMPIIPTFIPWDFSLIPVTMMLFLQYKPTLNPLLKAVIYSALASFVGEPLFEWVGLYTSENWSSLYSFPIYITIYLIAYRISKVKSYDPL